MLRAINPFLCCPDCGNDDKIKTSGTGYIEMVVCHRCFGPGRIIGHGHDRAAAAVDWNEKVIARRQERAREQLGAHDSNLARFASLLAAGFGADEASKVLQDAGFTVPEGCASC